MPRNMLSCARSYLSYGVKERPAREPAARAKQTKSYIASGAPGTMPAPSVIPAKAGISCGSCPASRAIA